MRHLKSVLTRTVNQLINNEDRKPLEGKQYPDKFILKINNLATNNRYRKKEGGLTKQGAKKVQQIKAWIVNESYMSV